MRNLSAFYFLNSLKYCILYKDNFPWHTIYRALMLSRTQKGNITMLCEKNWLLDLGNLEKEQKLSLCAYKKKKKKEWGKMSDKIDRRHQTHFPRMGNAGPETPINKLA